MPNLASAPKASAFLDHGVTSSNVRVGSRWEMRVHSMLIEQRKDSARCNHRSQDLELLLHKVMDFIRSNLSANNSNDALYL